MRVVKFKVVYQQTICACGEANISCVDTFDTIEDAETFCLNNTTIPHYLWVQKVFVLE